jgi:hypothetical protein
MKDLFENPKKVIIGLVIAWILLSIILFIPIYFFISKL